MESGIRIRIGVKTNPIHRTVFDDPKMIFVSDADMYSKFG